MIFVSSEPFTFLNSSLSVPNLYSLTTYRNCLNHAYYETEDFQKFIESYRLCVQRFIPLQKEWDTFRMGRFGEDKVFLPMKSTFDQRECNWLTIGIGGTSNTEKLFKEKYPGCKVFGIEPSPDQYDEFEKYGTVIPYGVGKYSFTKSIQIIENCFKF